MERLTYRDANGECWYCGDATPADRLHRLTVYEDLGPADHLRELVQAEQDGRLVVLPVPVGNGKMAYGIYDMDPLSAHVVGIDCGHLDGLEIYPTGEIVVEADGWEIGESDIGKNVFLTHNDAETALSAKGGHDG